MARERPTSLSNGSGAVLLVSGFGFAYPLGIQQAFLDSVPARLPARAGVRAGLDRAAATVLAALISGWRVTVAIRLLMSYTITNI